MNEKNKINSSLLINQYVEYLKNSLYLSKKHSLETARYVKLFLQETFDLICSKEIQPQSVRNFILSYTADKGSGSGQRMVGALRSFFQYLKQTKLAIDLTNCLPKVPTWKRSSYPEVLSSKDIDKILECTDRNTPVGMRDYAIILLFARLGLRLCELCSLSLHDVDWFNGEILVYGKGRENRLPMSQEVGENLMRYLRYARPVCYTQSFFISNNSPLRGLKHTAVRAIINSALKRAGLNPVRKGPNLLRHSLATELLQHNATLEQIAAVLGHKHISTTSTYIAVKVEELRKLVRPWPLQAKEGGI